MDIKQSGTRKEEKLMPQEDLEKMWSIRRHVFNMPPAKQIQTLLDRMKPHSDMKSFLDSVRA